MGRERGEGASRKERKGGNDRRRHKEEEAGTPSHGSEIKTAMLPFIWCVKEKEPESNELVVVAKGISLYWQIWTRLGCAHESDPDFLSLQLKLANETSDFGAIEAPFPLKVDLWLKRTNGRWTEHASFSFENLKGSSCLCKAVGKGELGKLKVVQTGEKVVGRLLLHLPVVLTRWENFFFAMLHPLKPLVGGESETVQRYYAQIKEAHDGSDVTMDCAQGEKLYLHRVVLITNSDYFRQHLIRKDEDGKGKKKRWELSVGEVEVAQVKTLIRFLYLQQLGDELAKAPFPFIKTVLELAQTFLMPAQFKIQAERALMYRLDDESVPELLALAERFSLRLLRNLAITHLASDPVRLLIRHKKAIPLPIWENDVSANQIQRIRLAVAI